jgi:hypothetical protein
MKLNSLLLLAVLFLNCISAQNKKQEKSSFSSIETIFNDIQQEKFFLHTNKTTYFSGEKIWWKAYVVSDFNDKVTPNTTNLYINFYNSDKKLISHQLFYCKDGKTFGEISLPKSLKTGRYFINLDTEWNKNFHTKYIVPIDIVNTKTDKHGNKLEENLSTQTPQEENTTTIKLYPESGDLLADIVNTVFFTTKRGSNFVANTKGYLINDNSGDTISQFKSNRFGYGILKFHYQKKESYSAKLNDDKTVFKLASTSGLGIVIQRKETQNNKKQKFSIKISKAFAKQYHKKELFATIHRNNKLLYVVPFKINKKHRSYGLNISDENLFNGVNTITLFNHKNELIAERPFFHLKKNQLNFEVVKNKTTTDSITLDFKSNDAITSNLSISVLPHKSKLNKNPSHILATFLAAPYLTNEVNARLFFDKTVSSFEKDIILQTQQLKTNVKTSLSTKSKPTFKMENGLRISGKINTDLSSFKNHKILLSSTENEILLTTKLKKDASFEFNQLNLKEKSNYKLALIDVQGKLVKARFYIYEDKISKVDSLIVHSEQLNTIIEKQNPIILNSNSFVMPLDKNREILDEVIINSKRNKEETIAEVYSNNPNQLGNGFSKNIEIKEQDRLNNTLLEFLGNQVGVSAGVGGVIIQRAAYNSLTGNNLALIILDGTPTDAEVLVAINLYDVKSIKINALGAGYGMRGGSGVVIIDLKDGTEDYVIVPNKKYFLSETDFGFSTSTIRYEKFNSVFSSKLSRSYFETLDWIPNLDLQPNTIQELQVYKGNHQKIKLFINGMNNQGQLVYKTVELSIK